MMIRVEYPNGTQQLVPPYVLNQLIASRAITRFERSGGWVSLDGNASLRRTARDSFFGNNSHHSPTHPANTGSFGD